MARSKIFCVTLLVLSLFGCATMGPALEDRTRSDVPSKFYIDAVPFLSQSDFQCGPAALAMVLQHRGVHTSAHALQSAVYTPLRKGSLQSGLITAARRQGQLAYPIQGLDSLVREVADSNPVIVMQNLGLKWIPRWHYAVVVGYDLDDRSITLHSGQIPNRKVAIRTFRHTWQRAGCWGLVVMPPGRLPISAKAPAYLKEAFGLQQAGLPQAAALAFQAAVTQWPQNLSARMGLGNALYGSGDLVSAADVFRQTAAIDPNHGPALNNLAHVLAELGDLEQAELAARRAVALGGPREALYHKTLNEILAKRQP